MTRNVFENPQKISQESASALMKLKGTPEMLTGGVRYMSQDVRIPKK